MADGRRGGWVRGAVLALGLAGPVLAFGDGLGTSGAGAGAGAGVDTGGSGGSESGPEARPSRKRKAPKRADDPGWEAQAPPTKRARKGTPEASIAWAAWLARLEAFHEIHGHLDVPRGYRTEDGQYLYDWMAQRRSDRRHGRLSPGQVRALDGVPGWSWEATFRVGTLPRWIEALQTFQEEFGDLDVPVGYRTRQGRNLYEWVKRMRWLRRRGQLAPDYERALEALPGWSWEPAADAGAVAPGPEEDDVPLAIPEPEPGTARSAAAALMRLQVGQPRGAVAAPASAAAGPDAEPFDPGLPDAAPADPGLPDAAPAGAIPPPARVPAAPASIPLASGQALPGAVGFPAAPLPGFGYPVPAMGAGLAPATLMPTTFTSLGFGGPAYGPGQGWGAAGMTLGWPAWTGPVQAAATAYVTPGLAWPPMGAQPAPALPPFR